MFSPCCSRGQDAAGEEVIKPYTPTTLDSDLGNFELVIKVIFHYHVPLSFSNVPLSYIGMHTMVNSLFFCPSYHEDVPPRKNVSSFS